MPRKSPWFMQFTHGTICIFSISMHVPSTSITAYFNSLIKIPQSANLVSQIFLNRAVRLSSWGVFIDSNFIRRHFIPICYACTSGMLSFTSRVRAASKGITIWKIIFQIVIVNLGKSTSEIWYITSNVEAHILEVDIYLTFFYMFN